MEKKKLLLVAVSVGVFLVIVIGASILVFSPAKPTGYQATAAAATRPISAGYPASVDPADMVRNAEEYQGLQVPPASAAANNENNLNSSDEASDQGISFDQGSGEAVKNQVIINVARPTTAAVPDDSDQPTVRTTGSGTAVKQTAPAAVTQNTAPAKPTAVVQAPVKTTAPVSTAQSKAYDVYWVQTGSFSAKVRADTVKETLAAKGISSIIENRDVNGAIYYRVRVGPYTSTNEADYWLSLIKSIEGFEDSQIWKSPVKL
jgi:DedD protein